MCASGAYKCYPGCVGPRPINVARIVSIRTHSVWVQVTSIDIGPTHSRPHIYASDSHTPDHTHRPGTHALRIMLIWPRTHAIRISHKGIGPTHSGGTLCSAAANVRLTVANVRCWPLPSRSLQRELERWCQSQFIVFLSGARFAEETAPGAGGLAGNRLIRKTA